MGALLVFATLTVLTSTTSVVALHTAQSVGPALLRKMVELAIILLPKLVAHLALQIGSNFVKLAARNEAFTQAGVEDQLKILRNRLEHLFAKLATRANVLRLVRGVSWRAPF